jgi:hypothetical protein
MAQAATHQGAHARGAAVQADQIRTAKRSMHVHTWDTCTCRLAEQFRVVHCKVKADTWPAAADIFTSLLPSCRSLRPTAMRVHHLQRRHHPSLTLA